MEDEHWNICDSLVTTHLRNSYGTCVHVSAYCGRIVFGCLTKKGYTNRSICISISQMDAFVPEVVSKCSFFAAKLPTDPSEEDLWYISKTSGNCHRWERQAPTGMSTSKDKSVILMKNEIQVLQMNSNDLTNFITLLLSAYCRSFIYDH